MKVNKTVFIKNLVWYLSIVDVQGEKCAFWSHHDRTGISDNDAKKVFERKHFNEVLSLIKERMQEKFKVGLEKQNLILQN
jgi:hypothetical protein